jgi:T5orf172 domain
LINLAAYTTHALDHLARVGAHAIYVIRPSGPKMPVKIGRTTDPKAALIETARHSPIPVEVAYLLWTCGRPLADRIENYLRAELQLAGKPPTNGWYRLTADEMAQRIEEGAHRLYPTVTSFLDHDGMVELLRSRIERTTEAPKGGAGPFRGDVP